MTITLSATYDNIVDAGLEGMIDTVPLVPLVAPGASDDAICDLIASLGASCVPCPVTGGPYCLPYRSDGARALSDPALTVVERTTADIAADPACN